MKSSLARVSGVAIIGAFAVSVSAQTMSAPATAPPVIPPPQAEQSTTSAPEISAPPTPTIAAPNEPTELKVEQNFPTPEKAPSGDSPQLTTNAPVQALAEYDASRAFCMRQQENAREACLKEAEDGYHRALKGDNPGQQGNPGSIVGERGTPRS
jgi:hypothetical protein